MPNFTKAKLSCLLDGSIMAYRTTHNFEKSSKMEKIGQKIKKILVLESMDES